MNNQESGFNNLGRQQTGGVEDLMSQLEQAKKEYSEGNYAAWSQIEDLMAQIKQQTGGKDTQETV